MLPGAEVFDLFAVPARPIPLAGGQGHSVHAGDLVLSPGRDEATDSWLNPILAPLSAQLDHERPRALRLAMPIPTRDGRWVVDGWGATRFEPDTTECRDLDTLRATSHLLHARLASAAPTEPDGIRHIDNRWARAERIAFGDAAPTGIPAAIQPLVHELLDQHDDTDLGPNQLVHGDLAGNVLLDADGIPFVIDMAPFWRPALWAEATCVLDAVMWLGADPAAMTDWTTGARRQAMIRSVIFRLLSDLEPDVDCVRSLVG
ncbi:uncharacterized protein (TIGR02569 family) [Knoellia remsis]|uniref:Uncharacterized protein (TIGR02569 family) n=1 Tax=Knoellia remsis TaxID=407159 RepID=A0A2T0U2V8_9MICO|nr:aminoglycoside phosphotransferase [Knoellia remsis]PRY52229.1 uncharacterized protein (TIGR02569 family) [Knoellia remsis]